MNHVHTESPIIHNNTAGVKVCRSIPHKWGKKLDFGLLKTVEGRIVRVSESPILGVSRQY